MTIGDVIRQVWSGRTGQIVGFTSKRQWVYVRDAAGVQRWRTAETRVVPV